MIVPLTTRGAARLREELQVASLQTYFPTVPAR